MYKYYDFETAENLISSCSIEEASKLFGASIPTISRWKASKKYPRSAEIITEKLNEIKKLEEKIKKEKEISSDALKNIETIRKAFKLLS